MSASGALQVSVLQTQTLGSKSLALSLERDGVGSHPASPAPILPRVLSSPPVASEDPWLEASTSPASLF